MCLAIPGCILSTSGDNFSRTARVDFGGVIREINLAFTPEAGVGNYILVHVGIAIATIDEAEAARVLAALESLDDPLGGVAMKHVVEYRAAKTVTSLAEAIARATARPWTIMEICGGQTHAIMRYGLDQLLPKEITLIHGPGCPVCVTPDAYIDKALEIAATPGVIFCSFGDMLRVPGSRGDLLGVKARGGDVRIVYSPLDAVEIARVNPHSEVVFFAIGFETTAPANAMAAYRARSEGLGNFSLLVSQVLVPPAMEALLSAPDTQVQGFLAAGHVCTVMGTEAYGPIAARYRLPIVITGFEPVDILAGVLACVRALEDNRHEVLNRYERTVKPEGNEEARALMDEVFEVTEREWRGLGILPSSGLALRPTYAAFDAEQRFGPARETRAAPSLCISGDILRGRCSPIECPAFGGSCTPDHPLGVTMVSSEGACAASIATAVRRMMPARPCVMGDPGKRNPRDPGCPAPAAEIEVIQLAHGGGGRLMNSLLETVILPAFSNPLPDERHDGAIFEVGAARLAFTTDSYVVKPLFFPGGDIGSLAVNGTVNDLAMCGAQPLFLSVAFIIEEGFPMQELRQVVASMEAAARQTGVYLVTGDTKVVDRGKGDGLFVNTAGVGAVRARTPVHPGALESGDVVILSGDLGRHGMAIMAAREHLAFETSIASDCAPLWEPVKALIEAGIEMHCLRDLTRGGLASALIEIAEAAGRALTIEETAIPVLPQVQAACDLLGLDPLYVANEGRFVAFVPAAEAARALDILAGAGLEAVAIGQVVSGTAGTVAIRGPYGATRRLTMFSGEQLPRIC